MHPHAGPREPGEQARGRVAVRVVRSHGDQGDAGAAGGEELRVRVAAAVVGHLEDVGPQVGPLGDHPCLRLGTEVAGEQDRAAAHGRADDQGQVVDLRTGDRTLGRGGQDLQVHVPRRPPVAGHEHGPLPTEAVHVPVEARGPLLGRREGAGRHHPDIAVPERAREATHVVGVEMGDHHQRQSIDAEPVQTSVDGDHLAPYVDQHGRPGSTGQDEGIPLTDVAPHRHGAGRRPAADRLTHRPAQDQSAGQHGQRERPQSPEPPQRPPEGEQQPRQQYCPGGPGRPAGRAVRHGGGAPGEEDQPPRGPARPPHQRVREQGQRAAAERRQQPQHRGGRNRRSGQEVGRERDQADRPGQAGDQRSGHRTGRRAHGHRVGRYGPPPPPAQPA